eukprot:Em0003g1163a
MHLRSTHAFERADDSDSMEQMAIERAILLTQPESSVHKVKDLCRTRWVQRIDGLLFSYQSTVTCLESICNDGPHLWTSDSVTDARTLQLDA